MEIHIKTIPHNNQRYETCGDWIFDGDKLFISVSDTGNDNYSFMVALHEMVEAWLCKDRGIDGYKITDFDCAFENIRQEGNTDEVGDDPEAPYQNEHLFATGIEKMMCSALGIKWAKYDNTINSL